MMARDPTSAGTWLLSLPPTPRQTRWVIAVAACQLAALALLAPFAGIQVGQINGFIPAVESVVFVTDLVTAVLLFSQFATHRLSALLVLACGYLLSALIIIPHALSFPGAFSPIGLPGAGLQTTPWLYLLWHFCFAMALLGYGLMKTEKSERGPARGSSPAAIVRSVALVLALVCGLVLIATAGKDYLPALFADSVRGVPANALAISSVSAITILACVTTIAVLWLRPRSVLDQWLMIVALAVLLELVIVVMLSPTRFDIGFYAGRLLSLLTSTVVLAVLLAETMRLYADVARANEGKIRRLVDSNIIGILIGNLDGRVREANQAFLQIVGYDQADVAAGRLRRTELTPTEWHDRDVQAVAEMKATGSAQPFEKEYFRKDGTRVPVLVGGATFGERQDGLVVFVVDLTDRKRAEAVARENELRYHDVRMELAHANRVATMGQLTASIAHEVSQPIATSLTNAEAAVRWLAGPPPNLEKARQAINRIIDDGTRATNIVGRIRNFSKKTPAQMESVDINEAILEVVGLTRGEMSKNGVLAKTRLAKRLPLILADRVQLQQVILNLIMNAIEAMSEVQDGSRELSISTSKPDADTVLVALSDSGPGLPDAGPERIFEAFYTTKASGLGMGLSICRSIVEAHGGRLWAAPSQTRGAVFSLMLPIGK